MVFLPNCQKNLKNTSIYCAGIFSVQSILFNMHMLLYTDIEIMNYWHNL